MDLIQPKILKGFRDFLPQDEILRSDLIEKLTHTYRSYGFVPIDTPVLEYTEILLRKSNGETEKQMFRFEDNGGRDVAMRFDLTVPFARYTAQHKEELYFPFKRYHISKVWRGEKPQAGRYREFIQCDFDTVGTDSATADFEVLALMKAALASIGVEKITIHVNHRGIFNRFLEKIGAKDKSDDILRIVDKLAKVGEEEVKKELSEVTGNAESAEKILGYIKPCGSFEETLANIENLAGGEDLDSKRMKDIYAMMKAAGIDGTYTLDPSITRGLDYYTKTAFEIKYDNLGAQSAVCGGGRYDGLVEEIGGPATPAVGFAVGLERVLLVLEEQGLLPDSEEKLDVYMVSLGEAAKQTAFALTDELRQAGLVVEADLAGRSMKAQMKSADKSGARFAILIGEDEVASGTVQFRDLKAGTQEPVARKDILDRIESLK